MFIFWKKHGVDKKDLLVPASILIGSILISASIVWGGGEASSIASEKKSEPVVQAQVAGDQAAVGSEEVNITKRKDAPTLGTGKVEIVEFSDFQCPFCQRFFNDAHKEIKSKYIDTGKAKLVFRHFPLPFHQNAQKASEATECAKDQGKFWQYHDILFAKMSGDGTGLDMTSLKQYAVDLSLNVSKFNACLDNGDKAEAVKKDLEAGQKAGVTGTPTIFINGKKIVGAQPFSVFEQEIEAALK